MNILRESLEEILYGDPLWISLRISRWKPCMESSMESFMEPSMEIIEESSMETLCGILYGNPSRGFLYSKDFLKGCSQSGLP